MKNKKTILAVSSALFVLSGVAVSANDESVAPSAVEEGAVLVQYDTGVLPHGEYAHEYVSDAIDGDPTVDTWKVKIDDEASVEDVVEELQSNKKVAQVDAIPMRYMTALPDDDDYVDQWHHYDTFGIGAESAWDEQVGSNTVVIAVIDSGVDLDHQDLDGNLWENTDEIAGNGIDDDENDYIDDVYGYDFVDDDGDPTPTPDGIDNDSSGGADSGVEHGTHVAGIIGAEGNNSEGVAGVMWDVQIMSIKVLDDEGGGSDIEIAEGIRYAVDNGADIINLSLGGESSSFVLDEAVEHAIDNGVLVIAAMGNEASDVDGDFYPACYTGVIGVTATNDSGDPSSFTNFDENCADIAAPGSFIYATYYTDDAEHGFTTDYGYMSGTSMATPVVAGAAGILLSEDSSLTDDQLKSYLFDTVSSAVTLQAKYGEGLLDLDAALNAVIADNGGGGEEEVEDGAPNAPVLEAWTSSSEETAIADSERTDDVTPYFSWDEPSDSDGISGYYVYFGTDSNGDPEESELQTAGSFTPSELEGGNNVSYYLRVKAVDNAETVSTTTTFEYVLDTEVTAPTGVTLSHTANGVKIEWDQVDDNVTKYRIFRKKKKNGTFKRIKNRKSNKSSYIDKTVKNNQRYFYKVQAVDDFGNKKRSTQKKTVFEARDRVVMAPGAGAAPQVRIYNTKSNKFERTWYAFDSSERGGAEIAVGQLDNDKKDEIAVARAEGAPEVRVFDATGRQKTAFLAYDSNFSGGVRLAVGDVDGDGKDEIVTVPGNGGGPQVKVWEANGSLIAAWNALDGAFSGGSYVTTLDWDGDGVDEIAVGPGAGGSRTVYIYEVNGSLVTTVPVFGSTWNGGVRVAGAHFNKNRERLVVTPVTGTAFVEIHRKSGNGSVLMQPGFFVYSADYSDGLTVAAGNVGQKANDLIVTGTNGNGYIGTVEVFTRREGFKETIEPFGDLAIPINVATGWVF